MIYRKIFHILVVTMALSLLSACADKDLTLMDELKGFKSEIDNGFNSRDCGHEAVKRSKTFSYHGIAGTVYLMSGTTCTDSWTSVKLNQPLKNGYVVDGVIIRTDKTTMSCNNDELLISTGEDLCRTATLPNPSPYSAYAEVIIKSKKKDGYTTVFSTKTSSY